MFKIILIICIVLMIVGWVAAARDRGFGGSSGSGFESEHYICPYCGSSDTDGSHCFTCGEYY